MTATTPPASLSRAERRIRERFGPWAVVTGASDGIGRACATRLAALGVNVVLVARREAVLAELADELARTGVETRVCALDLGDRTGPARLLDRTADLDVGLYIGAAGFGTSGDFVDGRLEEELAMIDLNCRALAETTHGYAKRFVARGRGGLVLMSSLVAFQGVPRAANYAATKAYVQTLAEALRIELKPRGVDVLAAAPGPVHSGFAARASMQMGLAQTPTEVARGTIAALGRKTTVRPGWLAKALELSLSLLPRWGRVRAMAAVMGGMTKHQP